MLLRENSLSGFIEELASANPTPGGGSAAAMAGAMATALILMSIKITAKKKSDRETRENLDKWRDCLGNIKNSLVSLIDKDAFAYQQVLNSFRMSKETDARKQERQKAIQESYKAAIQPPLEVLKLVNKLKRFIKILRLSGFFLESVSSDVKTAEALAKAASKGALANIEINLRAVKDSEFRRSVRQLVGEYCQNPGSRN